MSTTSFRYFSQQQAKILTDKIFDLLADYGIKLDEHEEMFDLLADAGVIVNASSGLVKFPREVLSELLARTPKKFTLGARNPERSLELPRPDGTFYVRTGTGAHGWIDPDTGAYRKVTLDDLTDWARLVNKLDEISFIPFLYADDAPHQTADVHGLATLLKNTDKHCWIQPYGAESILHLINLARAAAGGEAKLKANPVASIIVCSLTPRAMKWMDIEALVQGVKAGLPIHACSLPGSGGTAPATLPGTILLAVSEILAIIAMAQAVDDGAPVIACPIIFVTDMQTGGVLQSSVETMRAASGAIQFIKTTFGLATHNYGSGTDSPTIDAQSMIERSMLTTLMSLSGLDILGGAGQLEVATAVSPLQLIIDNETMAMARRLKLGVELDDDQLAWEVLTQTPPGEHFMTSDHTFQHCREGLPVRNFTRLTREDWESRGGQDMEARVRSDYTTLKAEADAGLAESLLAKELDGLVKAADEALIN